MTVVSVSMPESLLDRIDEFADEHGYTGRSEVVREAARNLLGEFDDRKLEGRMLLGVVTVLFDYETSAVEDRMMQLRHEHDGLVTSNVHNHVGDRYCMELFVLEGTLAEISTFVGKIRATRDTLSVDYSVLPVDEFGATVAEAVAEGPGADALDAPGSGHGEAADPDAPAGDGGGDGSDPEP